MIFSVPSFAVGFATGFGSGFFAREVLKVGQVSIRPAAKAAIRGTMFVFEKGREALAVAGETFEDLVAEARAELKTESVEELASGAATAAKAAAGESTAATREKVSRAKEKLAPSEAGNGAAAKAAAQGHA